MAAVDYYTAADKNEERLDIQARDIDQRISLLQARLRGFLIRNRAYPHVWRSDSVKNQGFGDIYGFPHELVYEKRKTNNNTENDEHDIPKKTIHARNSGQVATSKSIDIRAQNPEPIASLANHNREKVRQFLRTAYSSSDKAIFAKVAATTSAEAVLESAAYSYGKAAPWWIKNSAESEVGKLCSVCRHINFDTLLHTTDALEDDIPLGSLQAIAMKTECSFCRLVAHTGFYALETTADRWNFNVYCELCGDVTWNRYVTRIRNLCLKLTIIVPDADQTIIKHGWMQQILFSSERPPEQSQNDSRIIKNRIDLELAKYWLETCKERHNSTYLESKFAYASFIPDTPTDIHDPSAQIYEPCQSIPARTETYDLTLVDVREERLVDMPLNTTYIALSYVWGGVQRFQNVMNRQKDLYFLHSISVDNEAIPLTIRDAMKLVHDLGERYLWVDSLCICQDNIENKMSQIMNMGNIYSQALVTITAASGSDANAGLPGVQARSRKSVQRAEYVQDLILVNELCQLEDIVEPSYWNTRCWTYQEKQLSKRNIIFCETHIFFQCNQAVYKEDSGMRNVAVRGERAKKIRVERRPVWESYRKAVTEYTKRTISDESDAVNAFQGIAGLLQGAFKGDFLCGLPETELDIALLWQPAFFIQRRVHSETQKPLFPSWSWAGWIGEVKYLCKSHQLDDVSRVEWKCIDPEDGSIRFCTSDELRAPKYGPHDRWHYVPNSKGPPYYYRSNEADIWCLHPVAPKEKRQNFKLAQSEYHLLVFRAYTAVFCISSTSCTSLGDPLGEETRTTYTLDIFGPDGFIAGKILVPLQTMGALKSSYQEFVCLSRRRKNQLDLGPAPEDDFKDIPDQITLYPPRNSSDERESEFDHRRYNSHKPWPLYNVMMIAWDNGVAERIGLGVMHVTAFVQAGPSRKIITLA